MKRVAVKRLTVILILCFCLFSFMGCMGVEPIRIGFSAGLSGANSEVGIGIRNGVLLKVDEINDNGGINGRRIELVIKDDENDLGTVAMADQWFIDEGIQVVIGHDMSFKLQTTLEVIQDQDILMMSPTISDYSASGLDDNFIRNIPTNYDQGVALANQAKNKDGAINGIFIVDSLNLSFAKGIRAGAESVMGTPLEWLIVENGNINSVNQVVQALKDSPQDAVFCVLNSKDTAYLAQKMETSGAKGTLYCSNWGMTQDVIELGGIAIEGARFVSSIDLFNDSQVFLTLALLDFSVVITI